MISKNPSKLCPQVLLGVSMTIHVRLTDL